jgi:uncharacterized protein with von Willebrand factor type A (vWA) domain
MGRPRKLPPTATSDPETLVANVLDEVKATLRDAGISIPLSVWIEAQQAAAALLPNKSNAIVTIPNTTNGVQANV